MSADDMDDGRPLERGFENIWRDFLLPNMPDDLPPEAIGVFRQTFFAGAARTLALFVLPAGMSAEQFAPVVGQRLAAAQNEIAERCVELLGRRPPAARDH